MGSRNGKRGRGASRRNAQGFESLGLDEEQLGGLNGYPGSGQKVKVGHLVKQPKEPWFQTEWALARKAAEGRGFTADDAVGIGINGTDYIDEFKKHGMWR